MTSKSLHIALKKAVDDLGTDILKSPMLVNVWTDYHTFDVHDHMLKGKRCARTVKKRVMILSSHPLIK